MFRWLAVFFAVLMLTETGHAQNDSADFRQRSILFFTASGTLYTGSMLALGHTWYSKYEHDSFHWFNDNREWLQMDKAGHSFTAYILNSALYEGFLYSGFSKKKSAICSFFSAFAVMAGIEVFDGFSAKWGASYGDLLFNLGGTSLFTAQKMWMKEKWLQPKFSFQATRYAGYYPDALGHSFTESILKDYNGQTYWLAMPFKRIHNELPEWLCLSLGYGAEGMVGGVDNSVLPAEIYFPRYRQYFLSMDINLTGIKTRSTFLRMCFKTFNIIRIPFPALELSRGKLKGHALYF
jgi:uncharacterized protein YfiM (DUF2279 family)